MKSLQERITAANQLLAPYAVPIEGTLGRENPEEEDETRFPFQRDRDRIIHTQSFRRLKGKTQVFVTGEGDHYRTRLTHTMEVAQLSRDIARALSLNEDLAECIALAHDLGHPPFGHAGEDELNAWMTSQGSSFEHNLQSYRIVTVLEEHSALHKGLNLHREVLEGLLKHRTPHDHPEAELTRAPSLEAQLVNIADEIAYTGHDTDDGLRAQLFTVKDLERIPLVKDAAGQADSRGTSLRGALIRMMVTDLYTETEKHIHEQGISSLDDVYHAMDTLISFSAGMKDELKKMREFLWENMYMHTSVITRSNHGKEVITQLCEMYKREPTEKILELEKQTNGGLVEAIKDYVSGMTDDYALKMINEQ